MERGVSDPNSWEKFAIEHKSYPNFSYAGCGSVHFPPNSQTPSDEYYYWNPAIFDSICDDFYNFPNLGDPLVIKQPVSCQNWGCNPPDYYKWWFKHWPSYKGIDPSSKLMDWWQYYVDPNVVWTHVVPPTPTSGPSPTPSPTPGLSDGVVLYYKMNESSWVNDCVTKTVKDSSGKGNKGKVCPSGNGPRLVNGKFGNGGRFDGMRDYIEVTDDSTLQLGNNVTFAMWVYKLVESDFGDYFSKNSGWYKLENAGTSGKLRFSVGGKLVLSKSTVPLNTWTHVVAAYNGYSAKIYINGLRDNRSFFRKAIQNDTSSLYIGGRLTSNYNKIILDEVRIYNRELSPSEVSNLYQLQVSVTPTITP